MLSTPTEHIFMKVDKGLFYENSFQKKPIWLKSGKILGIVHGSQNAYIDNSSIKLSHNNKVNQCCVSMAMLTMYMLMTSTIRSPQEQIANIFLHSHGKHSHAKAPNIYSILGEVSY
jgi:hypothetical protein